MSVSGLSLRDRRRAETTAEIKAAALRQLAEAGPAAMSLRAVAREVGTTVQSLYHYFDSRDALLTELVTDGHNALADAVTAAVHGSRGLSWRDRLLAANLAYRDWAFGHRAEFLLLFGTPVPGFEPLPTGRTREAALRLAAPFAEVVYDGWTADELARISLLPGSEVIGEGPVDAEVPMPAGALAFFLELRGRLHGLVMLELLGHLHPLQSYGPALLSAATHRIATEISALQQTLRDEEREASPRNNRPGSAFGSTTGSEAARHSGGGCG